VSVGVGQPQLGARVRAFVAYDHCHPARPPAQVQQAGDLEYPGAQAGLAVGVVARLPGVLRDEGEFVDDRVGQGEPDRVRQPLGDDSVQQLVCGSGRVDPDQDLAPGAGSRPVVGQLPQRLAEDGDVVGGGVRAGVPGPSSTDNGSPVPARPWSRKLHSGWWPNPRLYVAAAPCCRCAR
jgi:hypothetical protein